MNIFGKEAEQALMEHVNRLRPDPKKWRSLHFHFSSLQPEHRQPIQMQTVTNIIQAEMGRFVGSVHICRDGDLILLFEDEALSVVDTMVTNLRFLFSDDPLASASYVSGQSDAFYTAYDLSTSFDPFFYLCLHKLSLVKPPGDEKEEESGPLDLPSVTFFQQMASLRPTHKKIEILVAEDSQFSRQMIRQALTSPRCEIALAKDGWEGLAEYMGTAPDIAFLDIDMPRIKGLEVLRRISEFDKESFVVMLTASHMSTDIKAAIACGAKGYIVKPFSVAKLTGYVDQFCRERNHPSLANKS